MQLETIDKKHLNSILLRDGTTEDIAFIFSTWLKSYKIDSPYTKKIIAPIFFGEHHKLIESIISKPNAKITIAAFKEEPTVILGYMVSEKIFSDPENVIHYIFVKSNLRKMGIATNLIESLKGEKFFVTHLTFTAIDFIKNKECFIFNPYLT